MFRVHVCTDGFREGEAILDVLECGGELHDDRWPRWRCAERSYLGLEPLSIAARTAPHGLDHVADSEAPRGKLVGHGRWSWLGWGRWAWRLPAAGSAFDLQRKAVARLGRAL